MTPVMWFCAFCSRMLADEPDGPCDDCSNYGLGCILVPRKPQPVAAKEKPAWRRSKKAVPVAQLVRASDS